MGISLNGLTPAGTYPGLIKTGDNTAISGTPKVLSDGNGNDLPMEVSTTGVNLTGSPTVNSVAIANTTQVAAKQDTLVSGTNIKTINGASLLGPGNIPVVASPSGVSGAIQFSNGSAFASDAANLFWDDTNNRLGIGTNTPTSKMQIVTDDATNPQAFGNQTTVMAGTASQGALISAFSSTNGAFLNALWPGNAWFKMNYGGTNHTFSTSGTVMAVIDTNTTFGNGTTTLGARLGIKGSGSTSATTSLLVQDSTGQEMFRVRDNNQIDFRQGQLSWINPAANCWRAVNGGSGANVIGAHWLQSGNFIINDGTSLSNFNSSVMLGVVSTTKGFLPPVMTTTQKNAIASPATGLMVMDITTLKLCVYNGSSWVDLH